MLAIPLMHIHPETDPHHGRADHVHAAAVHSVFSPDLAGEFDRDRSPKAEYAFPPNDVGSVSEYPVSSVGYAELEFSVLNDSGDRKLVKPLPVLTFVSQPIALLLSEPRARTRDRTLVALPTTHLVHERFTRPPPPLFA